MKANKRKTALPAESRRDDAELLAQLKRAGDPGRARHLMRFFRTGSGEYGEGDRFLGLPVPATRALTKPFFERIGLDGCRRLLAEPWHEARLAALLVMVRRAERAASTGDAVRLDEIEACYDEQLDRANNWDLVDLSAPCLMAACWFGRGDKPMAIRRRLDGWAGSGHLWRERAAVVATNALIRRGRLEETFRLAARFRDHPHDLIHKACGWMLREAGKRDIEALRAFLEKWAPELPRTALRYAIERMAPDERKRWLAVPRKDKSSSRKRRRP